MLRFMTGMLVGFVLTMVVGYLIMAEISRPQGAFAACKRITDDSVICEKRP